MLKHYDYEIFKAKQNVDVIMLCVGVDSEWINWKGDVLL